MGQARVALVTMPYAIAMCPSIQLGLIKAICERDDLPVDTHHLNLDFAKAIGIELYNSVSLTDPFFGDWTFTRAAFPEHGMADGFLDAHPRFIEEFCAKTKATRQLIESLRGELAPRFVEQQARLLSSYDIVGFTSTFQQNVAVLALARALKRANPSVVTVIGGSNVEGEMGRAYLDACDWIDVVVSGECDAYVSRLFKALLAGGDLTSFPGVFTRSAPSKYRVDRSTYGGNLDDLPLPDYHEFFERCKALGLHQGVRSSVSLPFESSRGCWWGQKHHCTFCGLNAGGMHFRVKSYQHTVDEIERLVKTYGVKSLFAVDNILDYKNLDAYCELLESKKLGVYLFYEVKGNLKRETIRKMARAGIKFLQPGIENFSDEVLRLMRKGTTGRQNLNLLRWCRAYGVEVEWNLLYGFPGEEVSHYDPQLSLFRKIHHLHPPFHVARIHVDRFSPNYFDQELSGGFGVLEPHESYRYIYPDSVDISRAAYYFLPSPRPPKTVSESEIKPLQDEVGRWREKWGLNDPENPFWRTKRRLPFLSLVTETAGSALISDGRRSPEKPTEIRLDRSEAGVYRHFYEKASDIEHVVATTRMPLARIESALSKFEDHQLVHRFGERMLALAVRTAGRA